MSSIGNVFLAANNASFAAGSANCSGPPLPPVPQAATDFNHSILTSTSLAPQLSQDQTNGGSIFGTLDAPRLLPFLPSNGSTGSCPPWGCNVTTNNTDPEIAPDTGVTRSYDFTVSRGFLRPDGVNRSMLLVNGQFPGPMIEANWGDTINITVRNAIDSASEDGIRFDAEGTSLHWHGLLQNGTQYYDGVPSVQQCPIAPKSSFSYSFKADLYGTSWYHSHFSAQYSAGAAGPMVIHGPSSAPYDIDVGPVMLSDWNHDDYYTLVQQDMDFFQPPVASDNTLINGKMNYDCDLVLNKDQSCTANAGLAKFNFTAGKVHRLRLINAGAEAQTRFSIDEHKLTVIATDFVPIKPYEADFVTLGIGQRLDVLVNATGDSGDSYWMRSNASTAITDPDSGGCSLSNQPIALAAVYYDGADTNSVPQDNPVTLTPSPNCTIPDLHLAEPSFPRQPPPQWATQQMINVNFTKNETCGGTNVFTMNGVSFYGDYNDPILPLAAEGNFSYPTNWNAYNFGTNNSVLLYVNNTSPIAHPMHLHGHNFWVLAQGRGEWDGTVQAQNLANPMRRDVQVMPSANVTRDKNNNTHLVEPGYLILAYETNNPGVWPFHCHIAWHVSAGLYVNLIEQPQLIQQPQLKSIVDETCQPWSDWSANNFVNQIDSGLRIKLAKN